jgi:hypothetical protein
VRLENILIPELVTKINKHEKLILDSIDAESVDIYLFIKERYEKKETDSIFRFVYRSFYGLDNAGLTDELKEKYFYLLNNQKNDLKEILDELSKIKTLSKKESIQFSFATKLLHTLDNNLPIYDSAVASLLKLRIYGSKNKLNVCLEKYESLKEDYALLLRYDLSILSKFREKFKLMSKSISDVKVLDFILWTLGKMEMDEKKRQKAEKNKRERL